VPMPIEYVARHTKTRSKPIFSSDFLRETSSEKTARYSSPQRATKPPGIKLAPAARKLKNDPPEFAFVRLSPKPISKATQSPRNYPKTDCSPPPEQCPGTRHILYERTFTLNLATPKQAPHSPRANRLPCVPTEQPFSLHMQRHRPTPTTIQHNQTSSISAPTSSSLALISSASSLLAPSLIFPPASSANALASLRPKPVISRIALIT